MVRRSTVAAMVLVPLLAMTGVAKADGPPAGATPAPNGRILLGFSTTKGVFAQLDSRDHPGVFIRIWPAWPLPVEPVPPTGPRR